MNALPKTLAEVEQLLGIDFNKTRAAMKALPISGLDQANLFNQYTWERIIESLIKASTKKGEQPWNPDWLNINQRKYFPYAWLCEDKNDPSGFGFSHTYYDCWFTNTLVGSRLVVPTEDLALYAIRTFPAEYKAMTLFATREL